MRRVILARKASVVSEYKLTIAASVALEIAATLEASLLSKHVALFRRGKRSEHGLAMVAKKSALISRNCSEICHGQKATIVSVAVRQYGGG